jgi:alpha-amylase
MANGIMMQYFQWYLPENGQLWKELTSRAPELAATGFTSLWLPPCYKGAHGMRDVGYAVYDLFDLGEFEQKGATPTKYGTREELLEAIQTIKENGLRWYADVVFNHKDGGDETEDVWVQEIDWNNRNNILSGWHAIPAYTRFTFPGRAGKHSSMQWAWWCFDSLSYNAMTQRADILYRIKDKLFETEVSPQHGNYDYLLANDLDTANEFVCAELKWWGQWFIDTTQPDGFRIDAVKHIRSGFFKEWLHHLRASFPGNELFTVGEYWSEDINELHTYIQRSGNVMSLFDVPLHYRFHAAGRLGNQFDLRTLLDGTLMKEQPARAVTFVDNHDTQPCRSLESTVEPWFKPLAYAFILLRREGYPCVFYADYYGAEYNNCRGGYPVQLYSHRWLIDKFIRARTTYGYGGQVDYFDHPNTIGWTRLGDEQHPGAMAVVMCNGDDGYKWMNMHSAGKTFYDVTEHIAELVLTNEEGWGKFLCKGGKVSVWLPSTAGQ